MAYEFTQHESVPENISRVVREEIDSAIVELTDDSIDRNEGVHQARKRFKKIRAVLRLVRKELGDEFYASENTQFGGFGRKLSAVRDAEAIIETFDKLRDRFKDELAGIGFADVRKNLIQRRDSIADEQENLGQRTDEVVTDLEKAKTRIESWPVSADRFETLGCGLKKTYRRGQKDMDNAYGEPNSENYHEWRKRVKDLWYHSRLIKGMWPELMTGYTESLHRLSEFLGDDHDLVVFHQAMIEHPDTFGTSENLEILQELVESRQIELRGGANPVGQLIYAEKAKDFNQRMHKYWQVWRAL